MAASVKSTLFSNHETNLFDDMEEGFSRSHGHGAEDFSGLYSIKLGRGFTKEGSMKGADDHKQFEASLSGPSNREKSTETIVRVTPDHHHHHPINVENDKPKLVVTRSRSGRASLPWILRPRRLLFLFAILSSMGTMILIYLTLLISKGNNPTI